MPLRLTSEGLFLSIWNQGINKWETSRVTELLPYWHADLEVQPGTKVRVLLQLVDGDPLAKECIGKITWCDVDAFHNAQRDSPIQVEIEMPRPGVKIDPETMTADDWTLQAVSVCDFHRDFYYNHYDDGDSEFHSDIQIGAGVHGVTDGMGVNYIKEITQDIASLDIRVRHIARFHDEGAEYDSQLRLGEVLLALYSLFGRRPRFNQTEASRIENEEAIDKLRDWLDRSGHGEGEEWKRGQSDDA